MKKANMQAANQLIMMMAVTVVTQIFLLVKNSVLAANFGVGIEIDTFNLTTNISNFTFSFVGAAISTVLFPYLKQGKYKKSINVFITLLFSLVIILAILMLTFRRPLISMLSGVTTDRFIELASNILLFTILSGVFTSLFTLLSNILEFNDIFVRQKIVNMFATIVAVLFLVWATDFSIYVYAATFVFIALMNVISGMFFLKKTDFSYKLNFDVTDSTFKDMMKLMGPAVLSTGVYQFSVLIDTLIASRLPIGSISVLNFSNTVISMLNMLILANLTSYFYPKLIKKDTTKEKQAALSNYLLIINALLSLIVTAFYLIGYEGIQLLYQRGNFSSRDTQLVFIGAAIYIAQLPINGSRDLLYKYFYSEGNTFSPFINSICVSIFNLILSLLLVNFFGLYGVILGTVLASYISCILICRKFSVQYSVLFDVKNFFIEISKILLACIGTYGIGFFLKSIIPINSPLFSILIFGLVSIVLFVGLLRVLKSKLFKITI